MPYSKLKEFVEARKRPKPEIIAQRPAVNLELIKSLGIDEEHFNTTFNNLCRRWWDEDTSAPDSDGRRFITAQVLSQLNNPLILSIIADNLSNFLKHKDKSSNDILLLEICCACGATSIINGSFLRDNNQCLLNSNMVLTYCASSGNKELSLDIARKLKSLGKEDPGPFALYAASNINCSDIADIFSENKKKHRRVT